MDFREAIKEFQTTNDDTVINRIISQLSINYVPYELTEPEQMIAYMVKSQIKPYLEKAKKVRKGTKNRWYRFMELIYGDNYSENGYIGINKMYNLNLSRENKYLLPERVREMLHEDLLADLDEEIGFWNALHEKEDKFRDKLYREALHNWAIPALEYAIHRVDSDLPEQQMVSSINLAFLTKFIELRTKTQGLSRKKVDGHWIYF
ncbi:hypothetical protein CVD28_18450 [Bacillus sp. M6-12]|uniref:hypothetical protein n=1 Tax=Bacillus sp. M6-12 TaxID=2054166 RepID=UPI000C77D896|nr:hypothetical protein [Bacillus sp. M6-12]PLS16033.1 hypothetical protein CVD28_18450 [Bacillus sp. M6-12]